MSKPTSIQSPENQLIELISPWVTPLGYQIVDIEIHTSRQKVLRIYIDHLESSPLANAGIGIEDCVRFSRTIDEQLDTLPEIQKILAGTYELEVSSPGLSRPLRTPRDFERYAGKEVRVHLYRPLTPEEGENPSYCQSNPKQKNFLGTLVGLRGEKVLLSLETQLSPVKLRKNKAPKNALSLTNSAEGLKISIPLPLISKAHIEPEFDFERATKESNEL